MNPSENTLSLMDLEIKTMAENFKNSRDQILKKVPDEVCDSEYEGPIPTCWSFMQHGSTADIEDIADLVDSADNSISEEDLYLLDTKAAWLRSYDHDFATLNALTPHNIRKNTHYLNICKHLHIQLLNNIDYFKTIFKKIFDADEQPEIIKLFSQFDAKGSEKSESFDLELDIESLAGLQKNIQLLESQLKRDNDLFESLEKTSKDLLHRLSTMDLLCVHLGLPKTPNHFHLKDFKPDPQGMGSIQHDAFSDLTLRKKTADTLQQIFWNHEEIKTRLKNIHELLAIHDTIARLGYTKLAYPTISLMTSNHLNTWLMLKFKTNNSSRFTDKLIEYGISAGFIDKGHRHSSYIAEYIIEDQRYGLAKSSAKAEARIDAGALAMLCFQWYPPKPVFSLYQSAAVPFDTNLPKQTTEQPESPKPLVKSDLDAEAGYESEKELKEAQELSSISIPTPYNAPLPSLELSTQKNTKPKTQFNLSAPEFLPSIAIDTPTGPKPLAQADVDAEALYESEKKLKEEQELLTPMTAPPKNHPVLMAYEAMTTNNHQPETLDSDSTTTFDINAVLKFYQDLRKQYSVNTVMDIHDYIGSLPDPKSSNTIAAVINFFKHRAQYNDATSPDSLFKSFETSDKLHVFVTVFDIDGEKIKVETKNYKKKYAKEALAQALLEKLSDIQDPDKLFFKLLNQKFHLQLSEKDLELFIQHETALTHQYGNDGRRKFHLIMQHLRPSNHSPISRIINFSKHMLGFDINFQDLDVSNQRGKTAFKFLIYPYDDNNDKRSSPIFVYEAYGPKKVVKEKTAEVFLNALFENQDNILGRHLATTLHKMRLENTEFQATFKIS